MAHESEPGKNINLSQQAEVAPLDKARQELTARLEGLDVQSDEFRVVEDYAEFWDEYYKKGYNAFQTDSSRQFLAGVEERRKKPAYRELARKVSEVVSDFSRELTE